MTASTLALTPGDTTPGAGASTDTSADITTAGRLSWHDDALDVLQRGFGPDIEVIEHDDHPLDGHTGRLVDPATRPFHPSRQTANSAFRRVTRPDYDQWLNHVAPAGGCTHPIQLRGTSQVVDQATGEIRSARSTEDMPDHVIYKACGNRRASVCPSCAETYRADTYQLVLAGLVGGKGVPQTVSKHVAAFVTFTAPSFGLVHTRHAKKGQAARPCRPRRRPDICPHGVDTRCFQKHHEGEKALGQPLCLDCYDHQHQVVWNVMAGELWRRTTDKIKASLTTWAKRHPPHAGDDQTTNWHFGKLRVSYAKVAELQARGVAHFHALIRLDGVYTLNPDEVIPPCDHVTHDLLEHAIRQAVEGTSFRSLPHPDMRDGWPITWGDQLDIRPVRLAGDGAVTESHVAGYLAKYATKATEAAGHSSTRITPDTLAMYTTRDGHVARLINACWRLGRRGSDLDPDQAKKNSGRLSYRRLHRWAHMLGFGGHFSTKSRRYSTTLRALREVRINWRRQHHRSVDHLDGEPETTLIVGQFSYAATGWHTTGDALLANTAAAKAREHDRVAKEEYAELEALI